MYRVQFCPLYKFYIEEYLVVLLLTTVGTGSFPGVKQPGRDADHPPPFKRRGHERVGLYLYSPLGLHGLLWGEHYLLPLSSTYKRPVYHAVFYAVLVVLDVGPVSSETYRGP